MNTRVTTHALKATLKELMPSVTWRTRRPGAGDPGAHTVYKVGGHTVEVWVGENDRRGYYVEVQMEDLSTETLGRATGCSLEKTVTRALRQASKGYVAEMRYSMSTLAKALGTHNLVGTVDLLKERFENSAVTHFDGLPL